MDDQELKRLGAEFLIGEDLYGVSLTQLKERLTILAAEQHRIDCEIAKKLSEKEAAEIFFKKS